jgi:hypothetical protein
MTDIDILVVDTEEVLGENSVKELDLDIIIGLDFITIGIGWVNQTELAILIAVLEFYGFRDIVSIGKSYCYIDYCIGHRIHLIIELNPMYITEFN